MADSQLIEKVVEEVLARLGPSGTVVSAVAERASSTTAPTGETGLFAEVDQAVAAAAQAQRQLADAGLEVRDGICKLIKRLAAEHADDWGRFEYEETKIGRLEHKAVKLQLLDAVPGVEFLTTRAHSGDDGISLDEAAPWGVIGVITPVTHSVPTMTCNAISMIAAGNALVVNAHPSGARSAAMAAEAYNRAIRRQFKIDPLICVIDPPSLRTAEQVFQHPDLPLLVVTGGPAVARAALKQPKRAIVAGPGNPPVVVDETADLDRAARSIIAGGGFDNNLLCIGEKQVFVVASVFEAMVEAMRRAGAVELNDAQIRQLTETALARHDDHWAPHKDFVGRNASVLAQAVGLGVEDRVELLFGRTDESHPFVATEQMMPFVPFVAADDFDQAVAMALRSEHGFGHTAVIHSNRLDRITRMGRVMNTTIFVANGPSTAGLGVDGQGYPSYSIATPTGEGITTPLTFTRFRRATVSGALRVV